jgi:hypothetical protein
VSLFYEFPTIAELPVTGKIDAKTVNAAIELTSSRNAVLRFIEAARYARACQVEIRRSIAMVPDAPVAPLQSAVHRLFMEIAHYHHDEHPEVPISDQVRGALDRLHKISHGSAIEAHVLFADLRLLAGSAAGAVPSVRRVIDVAEQALLSVRMG